MEDKLNQRYENTKEFVEALSKYYKVIAICDADELQNCFPYRTIKIQSSDGEKLTADNKNIQELNKGILQQKNVQSMLLNLKKLLMRKTKELL